MFPWEDPRLLRLLPVHPEDVHLVVEQLRGCDIILGVHVVVRTGSPFHFGVVM